MQSCWSPAKKILNPVIAKKFCARIATGDYDAVTTSLLTLPESTAARCGILPMPVQRNARNRSLWKRKTQLNENRSQLHYNLAPVLYILNIELVKTNYRDIILNKAVKLSGIFRGKIDASMRTTCKISVTTKVRLPVCIMESNASVKRHPVFYRFRISIFFTA